MSRAFDDKLILSVVVGSPGSDAFLSQEANEQSYNYNVSRHSKVARQPCEDPSALNMPRKSSSDSVLEQRTLFTFRSQCFTRVESIQVSRLCRDALRRSQEGSLLLRKYIVISNWVVRSVPSQFGTREAPASQRACRTLAVHLPPFPSLAVSERFLFSLFPTDFHRLGATGTEL